MVLIHPTGETFITLASAIHIKRIQLVFFSLEQIGFYGMSLAMSNYSLTFRVPGCKNSLAS